MQLFECAICKKKSHDEIDYELCIKCDSIVCMDCVRYYEDHDFDKPVCDRCG